MKNFPTIDGIPPMPDMLRLRQKYTKRRLDAAPPADPAKLRREQSMRGALIAAAGTIVVINTAEVWLAAATGKFFPWISILQGFLVGYAIQRTGRGLDWRFPALAAVAAVVGSFSGGFFVALATTTHELQAGPFSILRGLTTYTWQVYFEEVVSPVDYIYALYAAGIAAFFAKRRLKRNEVFALRKTEGNGKR